jgi:hypothetical protein
MSGTASGDVRMPLVVQKTKKPTTTKRKRAAPLALKPSPDVPHDPLANRVTLRPDECWQILGISHDTGFDWLRTGKLKGKKIGKVRLIFVDSVRALLAEETEQHGEAKS